MSRIPEITKKEQLSQEDYSHFDSIMASRRHIGPPYNYLLYVPDLAARTAHLVGFSIFTSNLRKDLKELAICVAAREMDCVFEWGSHSQDAIKAGVPAKAIEAIRDKKGTDGLTREQQLVVQYVQELLRRPHRATPDTFNALKEAIGVTRLVELTGIIGAYIGLACSLNAFEVPAPPNAPVLPG